MNRLFSAIAFGLALAMLHAPSANAEVITQWTFEAPNTPADATGAVYPNSIAPAIGTGNAGGTHASALTAWSTPSGNGSTDSFSSTNWGVGDYYQFATSTTGFSSIAVSFDHASSNTGPRDFQFQYSTDGSAFTTFASYFVLANASPNPFWNPTTGSALYGLSFDLSSVTALNNQANVFFRLSNSSTVSANGGVVATAGTSRVDNFTVTAVPEPSSLMLMASAILVVAGTGAFARRRFRAEQK